MSQEAFQTTGSATLKISLLLITVPEILFETWHVYAHCGRQTVKKKDFHHVDGIFENNFTPNLDVSKGETLVQSATGQAVPVVPLPTPCTTLSYKYRDQRGFLCETGLHTRHNVSHSSKFQNTAKNNIAMGTTGIEESQGTLRRDHIKTLQVET